MEFSFCVLKILFLDIKMEHFLCAKKSVQSLRYILHDSVFTLNLIFANCSMPLLMFLNPSK